MERCGGPTRTSIHLLMSQSPSFLRCSGASFTPISATSATTSTRARSQALRSPISRSPGNGNQISVHGTIHKLHIPLPIGLDGTISPAPDGRIHLHVDRLSVLKLPVKGLLGDFHVSIADVMGKTSVAGIEASQNDLYFDTQKLLPAPHIHGTLTSVRVSEPGYRSHVRRRAE